MSNFISFDEDPSEINPHIYSDKCQDDFSDRLLSEMSFCPNISLIHSLLPKQPIFVPCGHSGGMSPGKRPQKMPSAPRQ
jgi:hypothetical protein